MFYGFVITEGGNRLLAKMVAGETLELSKIVMEKGTAESADAARKLTAPIDPGPEGTSTVPVLDGNTVNMIVEYRSDLGGGLSEGFWIGGFAVYAKDPDGGADVMIYYGSLGDAKQYVSAYAAGTAPDVRRYPVAITVTAGVDVTVAYPAEAWMTADDVAAYFNGTLKPQLEASLTALIAAHNEDQAAHQDIRDLIAANVEAIAAADLAAAQAQGTANDAGTAAAAAQETADAALAAARAAGSAAETAQGTADSALALAREAKEEAENAAGGCVLKITFASAFSGQTYTVTDGNGDSYTGTVPTGLVVEVSVKNCGTDYTITSTTSAGASYSSTVTTGPYFGQYAAALTTFAATLTVTTAPGAAVKAVNGSNTYTGTANSAGTATLTIQVAGTYTVTATLDGETVTGIIGVSTSGSTYSLKLAFVDATLNNNTWAKIKEVSDAGEGANYWSVGDTKAITINGTVGRSTFSNLAIDVYILGFNHNASREGSNRIHFQIGKINGVHVALVDSNYNSSVSATGYFSMNSSNTNSGGWSNCQMRSTVLGSNGNPTSPASNTLLAALPADLRAVMKPLTKYSDNTGGGSDTASYVTSTTDYLPLLSEFEYHGARTYANSAEKNYQLQYDYYKAGNSKVHYRHNATGSTALVFCRSVYSSGSGSFCGVNTDGDAGTASAYRSCGAAPCFAA